MSREVVLGAGPLGTALARQLEERGSEVTLVSVVGNPAYDMPGTKPRAIDGRDAQALAELCSRARTVFLCLNAHYVDWYALFPPVVAATLKALSGAGSRLVYADDVYAYGAVSEPITEELPESSTTRKGRLRAELAASVLGAHAEGRVPTVVGRGAAMYGPGALNSAYGSTFGQRHIYPVIAGRPMRILGDVDAPHTYVYVEDLARGFITLGEEEAALGEVWHVPAAPTLTHRELATIVFEELGLTPRVRGSKLSGFFIKVIGRFQADVGEVAELVYQFDRPHVIDHSKFEARFGADVTPHRDAIPATVAWYCANPDYA